MGFEELLKKFNGSPDFAVPLRDAVQRNAGIEEISEILNAAGIDPETIDNLLAEYQRRFGDALAVQDLDLDALEQVAGGGTGKSCTEAEDCDRNFKDAHFWKLERCYTSDYCDEYDNAMFGL